MKVPSFYLLISNGLLGVMMSGCIEVTGGAVEARWDIRNVDGERITCAEARLEGIAFRAQPSGSGQDPCADNIACQFPCASSMESTGLGQGTTPFFIPEGIYAISLHGLDQEKTILGPEQGFVAPSPVLREIKKGQLTDLSVNLIIVNR